MTFPQRQHQATPPFVWPHHYTEADRQAAAWQIEACVGWLKAQGFEVRGVQMCSRNPRIFIDNSPLCEQLEGAVRRFERIGNIENHYWVAIRFDCEVRWTVANSGMAQ